MHDTEKLLRLAKKHFEGLRAAERELFLKAPTGKCVMCGWDTPNANPSEINSWGPEHSMRAECVAWLCNDATAIRHVHRKGILIYGAQIDGQMDLESTHVPFKIMLIKCSIKKGVLLQCATSSGIFLGGSHISHLNADRAIINGDIFLNNGFFASDQVRLLYAKIYGSLDCSGGQFNDPTGKAISADGAHIADDVMMSDGFHAIGEVRLPGVDIGGNFYCTGGRFENINGNSIFADSVHVHGAAFLNNKFHAQGMIELTRSSIDGPLLYHDIVEPEKTILRLEHATVGVLWDAEKSWPAKGNLHLHGFTYSEIDHTSPRDAASRIRWLSLQPNDAHTPQPYEQLSMALRKAGNEWDAREILIEKNRRLKQFDKCLKDWGCLVHWLFGLFLGYGYKPFKALGWILGFIFLGTSVFHVAGRDGMMTQAQAWNIRQEKTFQATMLGEPYPRFNALVYSIDTFIPFIDLDQEDYWIPANSSGIGTFSLFRVSLEPAKRVVADLSSISFGSTFLYIYFWFHVCIGWFFTGLLIIGITGMLQRRSE